MTGLHQRTVVGPGPRLSAQARAWLVLTVIGAAIFVKLLYAGGILDAEVAYPYQRAAGGATFALLGLLFAPLLLLPPVASLAAALTLDVILTTVMLADTIHFRFYGDVISLPELLHVKQLVTVASSVAMMVRPADLLPFADVVAAGVLAVAWVRRGARAPLSRPASRRVALVVILAAAIAAVRPVRLMRLDPEDVFAYSTTRREVAAALGLGPFHVYDVGAQILYPLLGRWEVRDPERARVTAFFNARQAAGRPFSPLFGAARGRNVILVMVESLERFPVGLVVDGQPVAPHLAEFAHESLDFVNFFDETHLGTTADGEFSSLHSLYPLPDAVVSTRYPANDFRGLPKILDDLGYQTVSLCGVGGDFWNMRQMHHELGFLDSYFIDRLRPTELFGIGLADASLFEQTDEILASLTEPFASFAITLSSHSPFRIPPTHQELRLGALSGSQVGDYLQAVHYVDSAFGDFLGRLRRSGLLDRSIVVVYGDHHAFLDQTPQLARALSLEHPDTYARWAAQRRLPLLIRLPHGASAGAWTGAGGHVDIAPTVLSLLGVSAEREVLVGRDLTSSDPPFVVLRDGSFIVGDQSLIAGGPGGAPTCLDLRRRAPIACASLAAGRVAARERLEISDLVIRGNLVPAVRTAMRSATPPSEGR